MGGSLSVRTMQTARLPAGMMLFERNQKISFEELSNNNKIAAHERRRVIADNRSAFLVYLHVHTTGYFHEKK